MQPITTTEVESSQFKRFGFDGKTLQIDFHPRKDGTITRYQYGGVTAEMWEEFLKAESKGSWFIHNIKRNVDKHPYTRIEDEKPQEAAA
jgi:hypothetical protein